MVGRISSSLGELFKMDLRIIYMYVMFITDQKMHSTYIKGSIEHHVTNTEIIFKSSEDLSDRSESYLDESVPVWGRYYGW